MAHHAFLRTAPLPLTLTRCHCRRHPTWTHFCVPEQPHGDTRHLSIADRDAPDLESNSHSSSSSPKQKRHTRARSEGELDPPETRAGSPPPTTNETDVDGSPASSRAEASCRDVSRGAGWVAQAGKAREVVVVGFRRRRRRRAPRAAHDAGRLGSVHRRASATTALRERCAHAPHRDRAARGRAGDARGRAHPPGQSNAISSRSLSTRGVPSLARLWGRTGAASCVEGRERARGFESRPSDERTRAHVARAPTRRGCVPTRALAGADSGWRKR